MASLLTRNTKKRFAVVVCLLATLLVQTLGFPVFAGADQWTPTLPANGDMTISVSDLGNGEAQSLLEGQITSANDGEGSQDLCTAPTSSGDCEFGASDVIAGASIVLPVCASSSQTDCLASLSMGTSPSSLTPATFIRQAAGVSVAAEPQFGLPAGSTLGLWQSSVADAGGSDTYAVSVELNYLFINSLGKFEPAVSSAVVVPYTQETGPSYATPQEKVFTAPDGEQIVGVQGTSPGCAWEEPGLCGMKQDFVQGTYLSLSIRMPDNIGGWFIGRMQNPALSVKPFDNTSNLITVTSESVDVPDLQVETPYDNPAPGFVKYSETPPGLQLAPDLDQPLGPNLKQSFDAINDLRDAADNTATAITDDWSFSTIGAVGPGSCFSPSEIDGVVATNAMAYSWNPPTFSGGYLNFDVAGMHYLPDGSLALGTYNMLLSEKTARCLYGFTNAPVSASVTVTESGGEQNVATTNVSQSDGWINLAANGFTFSDPVIKVRITQKSSRRLVCVRGSIVREVRGAKCPAGFTKRSS